MKEMIKIQTFYNYVKEAHGIEVSKRFHELITNFDGGHNVMNAYHGKEVCADLLVSVINEQKKVKL